MRISDWSSDVCSSDLAGTHPGTQQPSEICPHASSFPFGVFSVSCSSGRGPEPRRRPKSRFPAQGTRALFRQQPTSVNVRHGFLWFLAVFRLPPPRLLRTTDGRVVVEGNGLSNN